MPRPNRACKTSSPIALLPMKPPKNPLLLSQSSQQRSSSTSRCSLTSCSPASPSASCSSRRSSQARQQTRRSCWCWCRFLLLLMREGRSRSTSSSASARPSSVAARAGRNRDLLLDVHIHVVASDVDHVRETRVDSLYLVGVHFPARGSEIQRRARRNAPISELFYLDSPSRRGDDDSRLLLRSRSIGDRSSASTSRGCAEHVGDGGWHGSARDLLNLKRLSVCDGSAAVKDGLISLRSSNAQRRNHLLELAASGDGVIVKLEGESGNQIVGVGGSLLVDDEAEARLAIRAEGRLRSELGLVRSRPSAAGWSEPSSLEHLQHLYRTPILQLAQRNPSPPAVRS